MDRSLILRPVLYSLAAFVLTTGIVAPVQGQVVTVSARPVDKWIEELRELGKKTLPPQLAAPFLESIDKAAGPDMLKGLDRTRSFGAFADAPQGEQPLVALCLPVTDADALLNSLKQMGLGVEEQPGRKTFSHVITLPDGTTKLYAFPVGKYLYLSMFPGRPEPFQNLRPAQFDAIRPKSSSLTVSARLEKLSPEFRDGFFRGFQNSLDAVKDRKPGEDEAEFIGRQAGQDMMAAFITSVVKDGRELAIDLELDPKAGPIALEIRASAKPGSDLGKSIAAFGSGKSRFRSLGSDSVFDVHGVVPVPKALRDAFPNLVGLAEKQMLEKAKSEDEKKASTAIAAWTRKSLASDTQDMGWSIRGPYDPQGGGKKTHVVLFGIKVEDPAGLEALIRSNAGAGTINYDVGKSNDGKVSIHFLQAPSAKGAPPDRFLGEMKVHFALVEDSILAAVGQESLTALKEAIELRKKSVAAADTPISATVNLPRIMEFSAVDMERQAAAKVTKEAFADVDPVKQNLTLSMGAQGDTLKIRLNADVSLLKFLMQLGVATQSAVRP